MESVVVIGVGQVAESVVAAGVGWMGVGAEMRAENSSA